MLWETLPFANDFFVSVPLLGLRDWGIQPRWGDPLGLTFPWENETTAAPRYRTVRLPSQPVTVRFVCWARLRTSARWTTCALAHRLRIMPVHAKMPVHVATYALDIALRHSLQLPGLLRRNAIMNFYITITIILRLSQFLRARAGIPLWLPFSKRGI